MVVEIPDRLNGYTFYWKILPSIYESITNGDYSIDFDMHRTELANPEGLVNLMAAAAMVRSKSEHIPQLYLPESPNLFEYMRKSGVFKCAKVPGCEAMRFSNFMDASYKDDYRQSNYFRPQFYGLFAHSREGSTFNRHIANVENIVSEIADSLTDKKVDAFDLRRYCSMLRLSLVQVIKNSLEHNFGHRGTLAYYMIQKTKYNTIEFVLSDIGQGILERMKKMLRDKDEEALKKYGDLEKKLNNRNLLFEECEDNPNLLALINAVRYREDSEIPGLHKIKEFTTEYDGSFKLHSGNYTVEYKKGGIIKTFHNNSYFSGCHMKIEMKSTKSTNK